MVFVNGEAVWAAGKPQGARPAACSRVLGSKATAGPGRAPCADSSRRFIHAGRVPVDRRGPALAAPPLIPSRGRRPGRQPLRRFTCAGPFVGSPGESHVCSDWRSRGPVGRGCLVGDLPRGHGEGAHSSGGWRVRRSLAGRRQLDSGLDYRLRVRFQGEPTAASGRTGPSALPDDRGDGHPGPGPVGCRLDRGAAVAG